jgi:hypothetical protein
VIVIPAGSKETARLEKAGERTAEIEIIQEEKDCFLWVRSLLAVYRQVAHEVVRDEARIDERLKLVQALDEFHRLLTAYETSGALWREGFKGTEAGVRAVLAPLIAAGLECRADSPLRAMAEFAAEEIAFAFDGGEG